MQELAKLPDQTKTNPKQSTVTNRLNRNKIIVDRVREIALNRVPLAEQNEFISNVLGVPVKYSPFILNDLPIQ
jgi:hypothetical protein